MKSKEEIQKIVQDATVARAERCKPVIEKILKELLDADLLFADMNYVEQVITAHIEEVLAHLLVVHQTEVLQTIASSLRKAMEEAQKAKWDGKSQDELSMKDVEDVINPEGK